MRRVTWKRLFSASPSRTFCLHLTALFFSIETGARPSARTRTHSPPRPRSCGAALLPACACARAAGPALAQCCASTSGPVAFFLQLLLQLPSVLCQACLMAVAQPRGLQPPSLPQHPPRTAVHPALSTSSPATSPVTRPAPPSPGPRPQALPSRAVLGSLRDLTSGAEPVPFVSYLNLAAVLSLVGCFSCLKLSSIRSSDDTLWALLPFSAVRLRRPPPDSPNH